MSWPPAPGDLLWTNAGSEYDSSKHMAVVISVDSEVTDLGRKNHKGVDIFTTSGSRQRFYALCEGGGAGEIRRIA